MKMCRFVGVGLTTLMAAATLVATSCRLAEAKQVGVWQFNNALTNSVSGGSALSILGGWTPTYVNETIGGSSATALSFPVFDSTQSIGMPNDAQPNGPGGSPTRNNWSIVMDVKFPVLSAFTGLWETNALGSGDGDYFIRDDSGDGSFGSVGVSSQYAGLFSANTWSRLAVTVDTTTNPGAYTVNSYLDGFFVGTSTTDTAPGGKEAVKSFLHLFTDDDLETSAGFVNSVAYYGEVLTESAITALGGPTAAGVPSSPNQTGLWQFNNNLSNSISGKSPMVAAGSWTPTYVNETIGGGSATVLSFPAFDNTQALDMPNQATPDDLGEVTTTNVWSIVMDVKFPILNTFTAIYDTDSTIEADGEYFIRDDSGAGAFGSVGISGQYAGVLNANQWTRLAITVDGSASGTAYTVTGYIDGVLAGASTTSTAPNGRQAIDQILHLFRDNDFETIDGMINSLAFYDEVLSAETIAALGAASAAGIPVAAAVQDADFDNDGDVDGADFLRWQRGFGATSGATNAQGDADGNGAINAADLAIWKSKFGGAAAAAVPEPASAALVALTVGALWISRRRD